MAGAGNQDGFAPAYRGSPGEEDRLAALRRYRILDTPAEEPFNRVAMLACDLLRTEIALVSFLDETRQWFKARIGLEVTETPRSCAFCAYSIAPGGLDVFVVRDASRDPRFAANPLVTGEPSIRFYAGAPMRTPDGFALGTVCVISRSPRPAGISGSERRWLTALAALAVDELELRLQARRAEEAAAAEARLRRAQEAAGVVAFEASAARGQALEGALQRLLGLNEDAPLELHGLAAAAHPEERPRLEATARRLAGTGGPLQEEFRVTMPDGAVLWAQVSGEVRLGTAGDPGGWRVSGLLRDVTERRRSDERQLLMTRELDHRSKNALAVVLAALRLTPAEDPRAYASAVEGRVAALARAHTLLTRERWAGADLGALVQGELRPFLEPPGPDEAPRATVEGPKVLLAAQAAQPLSMALHELATNATRHGALSAPGGRLAVSWSVDPGRRALRLRWAESGGPGLEGPPGRRGFGTRVMRGTISDQLGGRLDWEWPPSGLICEICLPAARAFADAALSTGLAAGHRTG
ncbi:HWE histidine kinase domain-containing protein [Paracraurococcus lichenis]|uniref:histidine kinase n=1 Tax=Paracraurococcus lichenis TaxID=3064888 RepID=A0ABT9E1T9_9PROT|nr:HWE histidine kinase domain-containing protein [Paracraurococcus sp. LOR1-02]MDO9710075.1 HWE histidine kinase domain-containing protein [Paracraurococcus sp. LOR1-02]